MSSQTPNIANTPQEIALSIAVAKHTISFATGRVTIAILVHNEDNEVLTHNIFDEGSKVNGSPLLTDLILTHEINLRLFVAAEDADISVKSLTEDAVVSKLGIVDVKNTTVIHVCSNVETARIVLFVACSVESSEVPDALMVDLRWLPESALRRLDLRALIALLGVEDIGRLMAAREHWKQQETSLDTLPDLVSSLPTASAHSAQGGGMVEAKQDTGPQSDSESFMDSNETDGISDIDEDVLTPAHDCVFGEENLSKSNTGTPRRESQSTHRVEEDLDTEHDSDDLGHNGKDKKSKKGARRVFQLDPVATRGSRGPRKHQNEPALMVDPTYLHHGPRFALPAQKVGDRRFQTKISRHKISVASDKKIIQSKIMWEDLPRNLT